MKKGQLRIRCSFANAILRGTCPFYQPRRYRHECRGYDQCITVIRLDRSTRTIFHCKHDPPTAEQLELSFPDRGRGKGDETE